MAVGNESNVVGCAARAAWNSGMPCTVRPEGTVTSSTPPVLFAAKVVRLLGSKITAPTLLGKREPRTGIADRVGH